MASSRETSVFSAVRAEGAMLPPELLLRVGDLDADLPDLSAKGYGLSGETLGEAAGRAWSRMTAAHNAFAAAVERLPDGDAATTLTREKLLLPLFDSLGFGRLQTARAVELDDRSYPVSHAWQSVPLHLVGANVDLDTKTPGVKGAATHTPHGLVQSLLNRDPSRLWGVVTNGRTLRLLRDSKSLVRAAYVEFDLGNILSNGLYADFRLLWLLLHVTNFESDIPAKCRLERWSQLQLRQGVRLLDDLRAGVQEAIVELGRGFLEHPRNDGLRRSLRDGSLDKQEYYRRLLRVVYRLIFLFVAEDRTDELGRPLLLDPDASDKARDTYQRYYSARRLRDLSAKVRGSGHGDLYEQLKLVSNKLGDGGCAALALPELGGWLWSAAATGGVGDASLSNRRLLAAVRSLAFTRTEAAGRNKRSRRMAVDYRHLGHEELGSVYESLLELHPDLDADAHSFSLDSAAGNDRKTTGSYYTPVGLVECLLDTALDPVLDRAAASPDPEAAILNLKVCDPACGSGHFLIAAAARIARRLAAVRTGDDEPPPQLVRTAMRQVVNLCIFGVDKNEMSAELCRFHLWLEALEAGKPLGFLDHHVRVGDSLIGTTPALLKDGLPDSAFAPIEGDDKKLVAQLKRDNKSQRGGQGEFEFEKAKIARLGEFRGQMHALERVLQDRPVDVADVRRRFDETREEYKQSRFYFDAWCAAFVWPKSDARDFALTHKIVERVRLGGRNAVEPEVCDRIDALRGRYGFFHWPLEFPQIFDPATGAGGFDVVIGNPPWERVKLQEKEWFAQRVPDIAAAANAAARGRLIRKLIEDDPSLHAAFLADKRLADGTSHLARNGGRYPLCGRGDVNTYPLFAEHNRTITGRGGRSGFIVPSGIATDDTTKHFFRDLVESGDLSSLFDLENREKIFAEVDSRMKFCLLTLRDGARTGEVKALSGEVKARAGDVEARSRDTSAPPGHTNGPPGDAEALTRGTNARTSHTKVRLSDAEALPGDVNVLSGGVNALPDVASAGVAHRHEPVDAVSRPALAPALFAFFLHDVAELSEPGRVFSLTAGDLALLNPNTRTCPIFRTERDAELTKRIYRRVASLSADGTAVLVEERPGKTPDRNPWGVRFLRMFDMSNDSSLFRGREAFGPSDVLRGNAFETADGQSWLPLYEAKFIHQFEHRHADVAAGGSISANQAGDIPPRERADPARVVQPRYWVREADAKKATPDAAPSGWMIGFRDVTRSTDFRTCTFSLCPPAGVGHTMPLVFLERPARDAACFLGCVNSFAQDFAARQKPSGIHLTFFIVQQLPILPPKVYNEDCPWDFTIDRDGEKEHRTYGAWVAERVLELTYTAHDLSAFAADCGWRWAEGKVVAGERAQPPWRWSARRRFALRAELDAAFLVLYGLDADAAAYMLDTFPIVRRRDEKEHGSYRTKEAILHLHAALTACAAEGRRYVNAEWATGEFAYLRLDRPESGESDVLPVDYELPAWPVGEKRPGGWPAQVHPVYWNEPRYQRRFLNVLWLVRRFVGVQREALLWTISMAEDDLQRAAFLRTKDVSEQDLDHLDASGRTTGVLEIVERMAETGVLGRSQTGGSVRYGVGADVPAHREPDEGERVVLDEACDALAKRRRQGQDWYVQHESAEGNAEEANHVAQGQEV